MSEYRYKVFTERSAGDIENILEQWGKAGWKLVNHAIYSDDESLLVLEKEHYSG